MTGLVAVSRTKDGQHEMLSPCEGSFVLQDEKPNGTILTDPSFRFFHIATASAANELRSQVPRLISHQVVLINALPQAAHSFSASRAQYFVGATGHCINHVQSGFFREIRPQRFIEPKGRGSEEPVKECLQFVYSLFQRVHLDFEGSSFDLIAFSRRAGAPRSKPSMLISSSTSGQWMPNPPPIIRQLSLCFFVA